MNFRSEVGNFEYVSPLKFATQLSYFTTHQIAAVESDDYFANALNIVNAGDEIRVSCRAPNGWSKALFEVISARRGLVTVERITDWRHGGPRKPAETPVLDPFIDTIHVPEDCEVRHKVANQFYIVGMVSETVYATVVGKARAHAIARGDEPLPEAKAA